MLQEVLGKLREGYVIKEICIDNDIFGGKEIEDIDIYTDFVCIELIYEELLYAQISSVNWVKIEEG